MFFLNVNSFEKDEIRFPRINYWDVVVFFILSYFSYVLLGNITLMFQEYHLGECVPISLSIKMLPYYASRSILRILLALMFSLFFTLSIGALAAKNMYADKFVIYMTDVLQSVPVLGFLAVSVLGFIRLFHGSMLGPESASIFAIFTSQVWNILLSFYQSLKDIPADLYEISDALCLSKWQCFWRIEVPFSMPGILWNSMLSMSASWVFLIASEAITISNHSIMLPGVGSYIALSIKERNIVSIFYATFTMLIVMICYDRFFFHPLIELAEKYKMEVTPEEIPRKFSVLKSFRRTSFFFVFSSITSTFSSIFINFHFYKNPEERRRSRFKKQKIGFLVIVWYLFLFCTIFYFFHILSILVLTVMYPIEVLNVFFLGLVTTFRIGILLFLTTMFWVPIGVQIGRNPKIAKIAQPLSQFLSAFPVNLFFPLAAIPIVYWNMNPSVWTSPLITLGTQWYILFNTIVGTMAIPENLYEAVNSLGGSELFWWERLLLPGIFP